MGQNFLFSTVVGGFPSATYFLSGPIHSNIVKIFRQAKDDLFSISNMFSDLEINSSCL